MIADSLVGHSLILLSLTFLSNLHNFHTQSNERVNITQVDFILTGASNLTCTFNIDGNPISGCNGVNIIIFG